MKKIMYAKQSGNQVSLYDSSNREYCRVNGKLVSYNSDFVITTGGIFSTNNHVYDSNGKWVRDVQK
ncbi:MAG: hypothetical protein IJL21_02240 [Alphaproteobacteria bacterium]|nr:hypothetical protein [Alphaproteobacteria bacterium]